MINTNNLKLNFLYQNQIHKEIIINENLMITDAMIKPVQNFQYFSGASQCPHNQTKKNMFTSFDSSF